ncbi:hypothetical protein Rs2_41108 [Raphanus sativus]|nr:hypothetical protein Rs2_41108 [Raphanus sativus]
MKHLRREICSLRNRWSRGESARYRRCSARVGNTAPIKENLVAKDEVSGKANLFAADDVAEKGGLFAKVDLLRWSSRASSERRVVTERVWFPKMANLLAEDNASAREVCSLKVVSSTARLYSSYRSVRWDELYSLKVGLI